MTTVRHVEFGEFTEEQLRVHRAGEALHRDGASPAGALELLAAIIEDRTWERLTDIHGQSFKDRFREFVEARTPFGLGFDADQLPKVLGLRHPHEGTPRVAERMATMRTAVSSELRAAEPAAGPEIHAGPGRGKTLRDTKGFEDTGGSGHSSPTAARQSPQTRSASSKPPPTTARGTTPSCSTSSAGT